MLPSISYESVLCDIFGFQELVFHFYVYEWHYGEKHCGVCP